MLSLTFSFAYDHDGWAPNNNTMKMKVQSSRDVTL
jgi:hypothetical protein